MARRVPAETGSYVTVYIVRIGRPHSENRYFIFENFQIEYVHHNALQTRDDRPREQCAYDL